MRPADKLTAAVFMLCAAAISASAQLQPDGPTALVISYRAKPEARARFRALVESAEVTQLDKWRKDRVFASYQILFSTYAASTKPDMFLILKFNKFSDLAQWQQIEKSNPGGLSPEELALAAPETAIVADVVNPQSAAQDGSRESQFLVLEYDVQVDPAQYVKYLNGYAFPQFEAWKKAGILISYSAYLNQNPAGAPWGSCIVLEYRDLPSMAKREIVKNQSRVTLAATNPAWKAFSEDKTSVRKEKEIIPAVSIP